MEGGADRVRTRRSLLAVTITEVAHQAGVSIKTVSRVVNQEPHVREAMRRRVLNAMDALDYSPNIAARRLASNQAFAIGLLFGGAPGEYFPQIILSVLSFSAHRGYALLVSNFIPHNAASRASVSGLAKRRAVDGLIMTPPCDNDRVLLRELRAAGIPFVRITPADTSSTLPYVAADDYRGAFEMCEYLIGLGHRHIGFIRGDPAHNASQERFEGFRAALRAHRIRYRPEWVRRADFRFDLAVRAGRELLKLNPRPTAILASDDEEAVGVLVAAHQLGVSVPSQLSVAGFDDFPSARKAYPALTTVRQPMDQISQLATQMLIELIKGRRPQTRHIRVKTSLVVRDSTECVRRTPHDHTEGNGVAHMTSRAKHAAGE
jgi:LacI family transcriptional regulator